MSQSGSFTRIAKRIFIVGILLMVVLLLFGLIVNDGKIEFSPRLNNDAYFSELYICSDPSRNGDVSEPKEVFRISEWKEIYVCGHIQSKVPISLYSMWFFHDEWRPIAMNPTSEVFDPGYFNISFYDTFIETNQSSKDFPKIGEYRVLVKQGRIEMGEVFFEIIRDD